MHQGRREQANHAVFGVHQLRLHRVHRQALVFR